MNKSRKAWIVLIVSLGMNCARSEPARTFLSIPWEIRYLLFVDTVVGKEESVKLATLNNAADGRNGKHYLYLDVDELLTTKSIFISTKVKPIATSLLQFDAKGNVITNDRRLRGLTGKVSVLDHLVLMRNSTPEAKPYYMLRWSQGIPGNLSFGPSPCTLVDRHRYEDDWKSGRYPGDFGCREWTAQLFDEERHYIDVTTYTDRGNFIGQFIGWSRFKDPHKAVIGMNGKTWLCLHDCPAGEMPGIIADIKKWTSKHGFVMPKRPPHQPEFPDRDYYDDLHEFDED